MAKRLVLRRRRNYYKIAKVIVVFLIVLISILLFTVMIKSAGIKPSSITKFALFESNSYLDKQSEKGNIVSEAIEFLTSVDFTNPSSIIENTYKGLVTVEEKKKEEELPNKNLPQVFIYNTHSNEEYTSSNLAEYNVTPTVGLASNILREKLQNHGINSIVEERNTISVLKEKGWPYYYSYRVSKSFMEEIKEKEKSVNFFIDMHRDSVGRDITYKNINGKDYARILFIVGLENPNYQQNLELTEKINNDLETLAPGITRGIYKKQGEGVDGVYNQDVSPNAILVEMGGPENTINEVYNSTELLANVLYKYIGDIEK